MASVFLLLLLLCFTYVPGSGAQTLDVDQSLSFLQNLLKEMNEKLSKHEEKIQELEKLNQDQAVKLTKHEEKIQLLEKLDPDSAVRTQTENHDGRVAFTAAFRPLGDWGTFGPFEKTLPIDFRAVISNFGNAYNSSTGFFTAPVRGAYHFDFHIKGGGLTAAPTRVYLEKNGRHIIGAYDPQTANSGTVGITGNGATLRLEPGDTVCVSLAAGTGLFYEHHHTTFSGRLLFPL